MAEGVGEAAATGRGGAELDPVDDHDRPGDDRADDADGHPGTDAGEARRDDDAPADVAGQAELQANLRLAARGDAMAWRRIVESYSARVYGLVRSQCGNGDLAEEITQSVFCTIAEKLDGYTELGRFEPWLFRIAMNRLRDEMRRRKRHATSVGHETLAGLAGAGGPVTDEHPGYETTEILALREAIASLSEADQQILHLRHCAELSFKQIAELLGQPLGTVLARQHRAFKRLQEQLAGNDDAPD